MTKEGFFAYVLSATRPEMLSAGPTPNEVSLVERHFAYLSDLTAKGTVLFVGRTLTTAPDTFGIAVFRAPSEEAARHIMSGDPAVQHGVMSAKLFPFKIVLHNLTAL